MKYEDYIKEFKYKINSNLKKDFNLLELKKNILTKVDAYTNEYLQFYGDTSVFKLNHEDIKKCELISKEIFQKFSNFLVYLEPKTYHITLTSFNNPYVLKTVDKEKIFNEIYKTEKNIKLKFENIKKYFNEIIRFKVYKLDLTTAIVLRVYPKSEKDYLLLMDIMKEFDSLNENKKRELDFYLPHVSLAYLNNNIDKQNLYLIKEYVFKNDNFNFEITVNVKDLFYQYHNNMGEFVDLYKF